jgi:hypothetical protein
MEKLVEKGLWSDFTEFALDKYKLICGRFSFDDYDQWLHLNKERFCWLAGMFMKEREGKT